ncbi:uncharacterized protein TNCV_2898601 [Trichonephila clavipes]|nr:uncharacterized protein TNCV_2898601 [Trichonephila clavipes]
MLKVDKYADEIESAYREQAELKDVAKNEIQKHFDDLYKRWYHTEQQLQDARLHLEELQIPEEQFFKNYHEACRNRRADEGYSCETSELVNRIIVLLNSIDEITTAMLYINIWLSRRRRKDSQLRKMYSRVTKNTKMADKDDQETDSSSTEHSDNLRGSDIDEDYDSKSEKPATFFYEAMKDNVTLDIDHRLPLTLDSRPPSVLPSSRSSTPTPPSPVETASPSAEGVSIPDNTSPNSEELQKMQICVLVPKMQVPTEDSTQSSSKPLKLSSDEITDAETLPSTDIGTFPLTESTCIETFPSTEPTDTETFPSTKPTDTETFPSTESIEPLLSTETTHTEPLTLSKSSRIRQLQEIDSPDNTLASLSPLPYDNPPVPELEQDSSKIDMERLHIAIHVAAKGIMENVMNEARVQLAAIPLGNVAEQRDEGIETDNSSQSSERIQPVSDGKRKGDLTDSDEESSGKMSKKRNIE